MRTVAKWLAGAATVLGTAALLLFATAAPAAAQRALADSVPRAEVPAPLLTLRPAPELRALAVEVAEVLELRTGEHVEVGDPPPPGVMEAVPTGHVALAIDNGAIVVVLGVEGGLSHDSVVRLAGQRGQEVDARAVALAVEALRDLAIELGGVTSTTGGGRGAQSTKVEPAAAQPGGPQTEPYETAPGLGIGPRDGEAWVEEGFLGDVEPLAYARLYSGASSTSPGPRVGVGTGIGLCVDGHCLIVFGEMPVNVGPADPLDTRYQYPTFGSAFYTRPFRFGDFTPGASLGFVTRLGYFDEDMGLPSSGLQTDLGARATLDLAYELVSGLDLITEVGTDLMLDRFHLSREGRLRDRGDRLTPWAQAAVRYRL